ncbi:MAG: hypothetical protein ACTINL_04495 [Serratia proteamaculans]|uniref:hypothetical protein n=1 Tax=Serratia proteamaculans TaxID=28151 RepID=UPI002178ABE9|nr:hypothetical protein [Serratia proteamaculans]CAI1170898.1 Uncharacterised protein [Serratia proteamaculans]
MNLHKLVRGAITTVNPDIPAVMRRSDGWEMGPGRQRVPKYLPDEPITIQLQPLSRGDLKHVDGLNLQGLCKSIHVVGNSFGVLRGRKLGGDLVIIGDEEWLVIEPLELWPDWCRLLVCLQDPE